jgi:hypothetical protein
MDLPLLEEQNKKFYFFEKQKSCSCFGSQAAIINKKVILGSRALRPLAFAQRLPFS